jgi:hypothetical protein
MLCKYEKKILKEEQDYANSFLTQGTSESWQVRSIDSSDRTTTLQRATSGQNLRLPITYHMLLVAVSYNDIAAQYQDQDQEAGSSYTLGCTESKCGQNHQRRQDFTKPLRDR